MTFDLVYWEATLKFLACLLLFIFCGGYLLFGYFFCRVCFVVLGCFFEGVGVGVGFFGVYFLFMFVCLLLLLFFCFF